MKLMAQVDSAASPNGKNSFKWNVIGRLINEPVYERGKYRLLAVLLRGADARKFFEVENNFKQKLNILTVFMSWNKNKSFKALLLGKLITIINHIK